MVPRGLWLVEAFGNDHSRAVARGHGDPGAAADGGSAGRIGTRHGSGGHLAETAVMSRNAQAGAVVI